MKEIKFTLVSDGSSDQALMPLLRWILRQHLPKAPVKSEWADLASLPDPPRGLDERIAYGCMLYPCDILFVHRDTEKISFCDRRVQIEDAVQSAKQILEGKNKQDLLAQHIGVVPKRMTEAWLLFDTKGIRKAAGNPNGAVELNMPSLQELESIPDPKKELYGLLKEASGLSGRRLKKFKPKVSVHRLANCIDDFSPLRRLTAFQELESEVVKVISGVRRAQNV